MSIVFASKGATKMKQKSVTVYIKSIKLIEQTGKLKNQLCTFHGTDPFSATRARALFSVTNIIFVTGNGARRIINAQSNVMFILLGKCAKGSDQDVRFILFLKSEKWFGLQGVKYARAMGEGSVKVTVKSEICFFFGMKNVFLHFTNT